MSAVIDEDYDDSPASTDPRMILQVRLRCAEGSVRWSYPGRALRVILEPNLWSSSSARDTLCIKAAPTFGGATLFVRRSGKLEPLLADGEGEEGASCFRTDGPRVPPIYIQTGPSPSLMGFRYELTADGIAAMSSDRAASCRPCNDTELLMAVCTSDFVVRGFIEGVRHRPDLQISLVDVSATKVWRQRGGLFEREAPRSPRWRGVIRAHLRCGVKPGEGQFLFTGWEHFWEAWLGCAPHYKDFLDVYRNAKVGLRNPCVFRLDE
nr:meteorin-like protein [Nerophis lumbriciformis]